MGNDAIHVFEMVELNCIVKIILGANALDEIVMCLNIKCQSLINFKSYM